MGWIKFVLVLAFLIASPLSHSVEVNPDKVEALILDLSNHDAHKRSEAAQALGEFPFLEVREALIRLIESESRSARPNSYVFVGALESLSGMLIKKDHEWLAVFRSSLSKEGFSGVNKVTLKVTELLNLGSPKNSELKSLREQKSESGKTSPSLLEQLKSMAVAGTFDPKVLEVIQLGTEADISHAMDELARDPKNPKIVGREVESEDVMRIWVRIKSRIPVLTGEPGVGKTSVAQAIALALRRKATPKWFVYQDEFPAGTVVVQTSAARIGRLALSNADSAQAAALELYLDAIRKAQYAVKAPIIIFMDEFHTLSRGQKDALKPFGEQVDGIRVLGATTYREFELMIGNDNALRRRVTPIPIHELTEQETLVVLKQGWISQIEARYRVSISDKVLPELIKIAPEVFSDLARPDSSIKFIQDLAIRVSREDLPTAEKPALVTEERARQFAASITHLPINPRDPKALVSYIEEGRERIRSRVIGQDHLVDIMVNTWMDVLTSDPARAWRSVAVIGTTGTGKTLTAKQIGEVFLRDRQKVLEVDCTAYSSGSHALNSLVGAPNGIISSDETKGILPEFLSGRGKESGVIIFNEFDKAHPDLAKKLMEMIDAGVLTGGDGHPYRLRRHLVVFTTNRGANKVFNERLGELLTREELEKRAKNFTDAQARSFFTQSDTYAFLDEHRLPPEVVNRIDRWCVAKPITFEDALQIAQLKARAVLEENVKLHKLEMLVDTKLVEAITRVAFVPADGARPVEKKVDAILSRCRAMAWAHLEKVEGAKIRIDFARDEKAGTASVQVFEGYLESPFVEIPFDEPTQFLALKDPRFLDVLRNLEARIKTELFGQDDGIKAVAAAVRGRANRPLDPAPLSIWLLGSTGTGKTETAKVLAKYLYGSPDRAQVISFGKVNHLFELNDIFGPPRGIIGSESKAIFENILESFPEGTVIVFDELSNMGRGANANERDAMYKRMYEIFAEGKWTNAHGKTYDLNRFTFILTGNEGEDLFEFLPSEDMRMAAWEKNHDRETVKKLLRKSGVPEAFLNRIDSIILYRPLTDSVRERVIEKFLARLVRQVEQAHPVKLWFTTGFAEHVARAFFPIGDGARGAERFVKMELSAFVGDFILKNFEFIMNAKGVDLEVDVDLEYPARPWASEVKAKPAAVLKVKAKVSGSPDVVFKDQQSLKPSSAPRVTMLEMARETAVHEAGHALVNEHLGQPLGSLRYLTIESAGDYGGYAGYKSEEFEGAKNLEWVLRSIAVLSAGTVAQQLNGSIGYDASWLSDRAKINSLAYRAVTEFGLIPSLEFIPPGDKEKKVDLGKLDPKTKARFIRAAKRIVAGGMELSQRVMSSEWVLPQTKLLVSILLERGSIKGEEFYQSVARVLIPQENISKWTREIAQGILASPSRRCAKELAG